MMAVREQYDTKKLIILIVVALSRFCVLYGVKDNLLFSGC